MLEYILEHAEPEVAGFITGNLQVFFENVRLKETGNFDIVDLPAADQQRRGEKPGGPAPKPNRPKAMAKRADNEGPQKSSGRGED